MRRISKVKVLPGYRLELEFDDGVSGTVDLSEAVGKGVFALCGRFHGTYPPNFNEGTHLISRKGPTPFQVVPFVF